MTLITNESMIFHEIYSIAIATPITVCSCDSHFLITKGEIEFAAKLHPVIFSPKFNKKPIYNLQTNKYQEFTNAYVYSIMVKTGNGDPNRAELCESATKKWNYIKRKDKLEIYDII
ncbi:hypothetical protein RIR_jg13754.t1 [Rhizophagus irregularis DAOM 181602=DAOM 197198]|nr:hypothetical protein RIR_jg13754.t1 [Rhizophagus irregularis DAOM 181602=DAOM 197198]